MVELTFACELDTPALTELFADSRVIADLRGLRARVSLATRDLSQQRAAVVRQLNQSKIPVIAWLVLPEAEGYWFHCGNFRQAEALYAAFRSWTDTENLSWAGIGIDLEPDIREMRRGLADGVTSLAFEFLRRLVDQSGAQRAQLAYSDLVARMRADGFAVESYLLPIVADERRHQTALLSRLAGIVDVPADAETLMLYTSFAKRYGAGLIEAYGGDAYSIGVGSTGGGVELPGAERFPPLDWEELKRDLVAARRHAERIFIFSLEGCVAQSMLEKLIDFTWRAPSPTPLEMRRAGRLRRAMGWFLRSVHYRWWIASGLVTTCALVIALLWFA